MSTLFTAGQADQLFSISFHLADFNSIIMVTPILGQGQGLRFIGLLTRQCSGIGKIACNAGPTMQRWTNETCRYQCQLFAKHGLYYHTS